MKKVIFLCCTAGWMFSWLFLSQSGWAMARTKLYNIRSGVHKGYTRLVIDSAGARPKKIAPPNSGGIVVQYENLEVLFGLKKLLRSAKGAISRMSYREDTSMVFITFKHPNTRVRTFFLGADPPRKGGYRLIMDFYPPKMLDSQETELSRTKGTHIRTPNEQENLAKGSTPKPPGPEPEALSTENRAEDPQPKPESVPMEEQAGRETGLAGEAALIVRDLHGEDESSKFTEYRDFNPVTGEFKSRYEKDEYFFEFNGENIGQDNQYLNAAAGLYGRLKVDASYDKIPHRYVFGAETLYFGVGTATLTLDDALQARLQNGTSTIEQKFAFAVSGDPQTLREKGEVKLDLVALEPFNFRVELSREDKEGTRPAFGSFGLDNTVELPIPVDHKTTELKVIAEYTRLPFHLSASYQYSLFENNFDTLIWDNPFRVTDALFGPSRGRMDLLPDNQAHNASVTGAFMGLPLNSQISATAAWGLMKQNDNLIPYTINTAISTPPLPADNAEAEVETVFYHFKLNSKPLSFMHARGKFRYFEYENNTEQIDFPGFADVDDFFDATPIVNLPTSYDMTTAGLDLGFDIFRRTTLTFGYVFERTDRTNREVDRVDDQILTGSIDSSLYPWLHLGASYIRTDRDISNYDFNVYLLGGEDLGQLPSLRKYTMADVLRDRVKFLTSLYPSDSLELTGSFIYGQDDFQESLFGLLEDEHHGFALDAGYTVTDHLALHAFYSYEEYESTQNGFGEVPSEPIVQDSDWLAKSEETVNTWGGKVEIALISDRLDFDLSYSHSDVDGNMTFSTPIVETADFPVVDETTLHTLETKLTCRIWSGLSVTLGFLWEKFDYNDFNTEGFTNTPPGAVLLKTLPADYDANFLYLKSTYKF